MALLALAPVALVAQALDCRLGRPQVGPHVCPPVASSPEAFACLCICDAVPVKVFEPSAAGSSGEKWCGWRVILPAFLRRGNPLGHGLSASDF